MKILYVITQQDAGGAQKYVLDLATQFHGSIAAGTEGVHLQNEAERLNIPFYPVRSLGRSSKPLKDLYAIWELQRLITHTKPTLIHANSSKAGVIAALAGRWCRVPVIFTAHGFQIFEPMPWWQKPLYWLAHVLIRILSQHIITLSERERKQAIKIKIASAQKSTTIYHGIKPVTLESRSSARRILGIKDEEFIIGSVANAYKTKGLDLLIEAVAAAKPPGKVVIIGDGPEQQALKTLARQRGVEHTVLFSGQRHNAASLMSAFNVFVLPSRKEGFPYVLLEALNAKLPIIATDVGGVRELLANAGTIIPPQSVEALSTALTNLIHDRHLRAVLEANAKARVTFFSIDTMYAQTEAVYRGVSEN